MSLRLLLGLLRMRVMLVMRTKWYGHLDLIVVAELTYL